MVAIVEILWSLYLFGVVFLLFEEGEESIEGEGDFCGPPER